MAKEKLKIAFVLPALTAGGAERVLITLMNNFDRTRFDPVFVAINEEGPLRSLIDEEISFYSLKSNRVLRSVFRLRSTLKIIKPDIVVSTMAHMNFVLLLLNPFFPKTRFIVREAVTPSYFFQGRRRSSFLIKAAYRILYPKAARVISPAQAIIDEFGDLLGMSCKNHVLLHNPVDLARIRSEENTSFEITEGRKDTVHFVSAGRLHSQKGFDQLIKALPNMKLPHNWSWTILGEGAEREALEMLIKETGLSDKISLPGLSDRPWPLFAEADCFLMPSRWEGLPNVILESLACGTPVIATRESGGIAEIAVLSPEDSVSVVDNMTDFIRAMEAVKPVPTEKFRKSILPAPFQKENVVKNFETILDKVARS